MMELKYSLFDGEKLWQRASVKVEDGIISEVTACDPKECGNGFLMPGLMDAHTHMGTLEQVKLMLAAGISATCNVSAPAELIQNAMPFTVIPSAGMAMGVVVNPVGFVEKAVANGAKYIKVLLLNTLSIGKQALRGIVKAAHEMGLKVAVHATEVATVRQAVGAGADILLHVPMKESFPEELAKSIAAQGIAVAPTLIMMDTFAHSGRNGYLPEHYSNAETSVKQLYNNGVTILAATDANPGNFAPEVCYGKSLHHELELLSRAGLPETEVWKAATSNIADVFGLNMGKIQPGMDANLLLLGHRSDYSDIHQLWIRGETIR